MILHAGLLALHGPTGWRGVLIEGPSGAGKSDLALRAIVEGFQLVADDRVEVWRSGGQLFGAPPPPLAGLIEARGLGVLPERALRFAPVGLLVRLGSPERTPEPQWRELLGVRLPAVVLAPQEASAAAKLARAVMAFDAGFKKRM